MSLGALEATVVSTAMPTVIAQLGGLAHYSWVFAAYLLTSTASVPIWGRLSDLYGRRRMYLLGVVVFLVGSTLSGATTSMFQLIAARAIQGLGAGAIIPLSMTIVGELYTLAERARTQALFSGVWGVASIAGPLVGGYITDVINWRWVFYLNVPFGFCCMAVIALAYPPSRNNLRVRVDWLGGSLLFAGVSSLLIALGAVAMGRALAGLSGEPSRLSAGETERRVTVRLAADPQGRWTGARVPARLERVDHGGGRGTVLVVATRAAAERMPLLEAGESAVLSATSAVSKQGSSAGDGGMWAPPSRPTTSLAPARPSRWCSGRPTGSGTGSWPEVRRWTGPTGRWSPGSSSATTGTCRPKWRPTSVPRACRICSSSPEPTSRWPSPSVSSAWPGPEPSSSACRRWRHSAPRR